MRKGFLLALLAITLLSTSALGASLDRKFGVMGKAGALVPLQDDFISSTSETKTGIAYGGGVIYGFARDWAVEIDVTHAPQLDVDIGGNKAFDGTLTDVAVGVQYRLHSENRLVPYFGLGVDFLKGTLEHVVSNANYNLEWTEGGHVNVGLDYFITRGIAMTAEARYIFAMEGDVKTGGTKVGDYNPMSFVGTIGVRLMLPEDAFW